jgi:hypothetical protein
MRNISAATNPAGVARGGHGAPKLGSALGLDYDFEPWFAGVAKAAPLTVLIFPALFGAGMVLIDTVDGVFMVGAYGWAFVYPARKLWYNLTITAISILVAMLVSCIEALGLLSSKLKLTGAFWMALNALNDDLVSFGLVIIGLFVVSWIVSALIYRWGRFGHLACASIGQIETRGVDMAGTVQGRRRRRPDARQDAQAEQTTGTGQVATWPFEPVGRSNSLGTGRIHAKAGG